MITIVLPVYNEELVLKTNAIKAFDFCHRNLKDGWQIVISDNGSDDQTGRIGSELAEQYNKIKYLRIEKKGKGYGVISAWQAFSGEIYVYMDIDLSTDLKHLPELINEIKNGNDIAAGSRFIDRARVERSWDRTIISYGLRIILKLLFKLTVKDAPCGFKAINQRAMEKIVPMIQNKTWFFDTEMLILGQRAGMKIKEIPVNWREVVTRERESKVGILTVMMEYIKNIYLIYRHQIHKSH